MKADMITTEIFQDLEACVEKLETLTKSPQNPEVTLLRQQVDRLDPANRSVRITGLAEPTAQARIQYLEKVFTDMCGQKPSSIERL